MDDLRLAMVGHWQSALTFMTSRLDDLRVAIAGDWPTSNGLIIELLLGLPASQIGLDVTPVLAGMVVGLNPAEERARAREALLGQLTSATIPVEVAELAHAIARLAVTAEERARAREALLGQLTGEIDPLMAHKLADAVTRLDPAAHDRARAREALLGSLPERPIFGPLASWRTLSPSSR